MPDGGFDDVRGHVEARGAVGPACVRIGVLGGEMHHRAYARKGVGPGRVGAPQVGGDTTRRRRGSARSAVERDHVLAPGCGMQRGDQLAAEVAGGAGHQHAARRGHRLPPSCRTAMARLRLVARWPDTACSAVARSPARRAATIAAWSALTCEAESSSRK